MSGSNCGLRHGTAGTPTLFQRSRLPGFCHLKRYSSDPKVRNASFKPNYMRWRFSE